MGGHVVASEHAWNNVTDQPIQPNGRRHWSDTAVVCVQFSLFSLLVRVFHRVFHWDESSFSFWMILLHGSCLTSGQLFIKLWGLVFNEILFWGLFSDENFTPLPLKKKSPNFSFSENIVWNLSSELVQKSSAASGKNTNTWKLFCCLLINYYTWNNNFMVLVLAERWTSTLKAANDDFYLF